MTTFEVKRLKPLPAPARHRGQGGARRMEQPADLHCSSEARHDGESL